MARRSCAKMLGSEHVVTTKEQRCESGHGTEEREQNAHAPLTPSRRAKPTECAKLNRKGKYTCARRDADRLAIKERAMLIVNVLLFWWVFASRER